MSKKTKSTPSKSTLGLRELAKAIDVDPGLLSRESKVPGFPSKKLNGRKVFDADAVRAWRAANIRQRKPAADPPAPAPPSGADLDPFGAITRLDDPLYQTLTSGTATAMEITHAALQLASKQVAQAALAGGMSPHTIEALKKTLTELRTAEAQYLEIKKQQGAVLPRELVVAILTECVGRLTRCLAQVETAIATEFSIWLADPAIASMPAEERSRKVREFVAQKAGEIRRQEADGALALITSSSPDD